MGVDTTIEIGVLIREIGETLREKLAKANSEIAKLKSLKLNVTSPGQTKEINKQIAKLQQLKAQLKATAITATNSLKKQERAFEQTTRGVGRFRKALIKANKTLPFAGFALSLLFFGQAVQRVFTSLAKSAISTFQDVASSVQGATTAFTILDGVFKFLMFTIGSAINAFLEPLIPLITNIVIAISQWIADNERLVGALILGGIVLGLLISLFGFFILSLAGVVGAIKFLGVALLGVIPAIKRVVVGLFSLTSANIKSGLATIGDSVLKIGRGMRSVAIWTFRVLIPWAILLALMLGILALGVSIGFMWKNITNIAQLFGKIVGLVFQRLGDTIADWVNTVQLKTQLLTLNMKKLFIDAFNVIIKKAESAINIMIEAYNKLARKSKFLTEIGTVTFGGIDTSQITQDIAAVQKELTDLELSKQLSAIAHDKKIQSLEGQIVQEDLEAQKNLTQGWTDLIQSVKDKFDFGAIEPDVVGETEIAKDEEAAATEDLNKILEELKDRQDISIENITIENPASMTEMLDELKSLQPNFQPEAR